MRLVWLLLLVAVVFGPSQAQASFSRSPQKLPPVIPSQEQAQVIDVPPFTLEIPHGLFCGNDPVNRHDPLGLFELPVHAELAAEALLSLKSELALPDGQFDELMRGAVEGVVFPDLQVRIPTVQGATPAQHIKLVNQVMEFKNWTPNMVREFGSWIDGNVDALQRNTIDKLVPGYAHTREGIENWWEHTPPVIWNALEWYQRKHSTGPGGTLARDIYQSHMGSASWQHFMSSGAQSPQDIQTAVIGQTALNFQSFSSFRDAGNYHNAGFELGKSLHYLQDSFSASHVHRDILADGMLGPITSIHDYSQQSTRFHAHADNPGRRSVSYRSALAQTRNMIRLYLGGRGTASEILPFYLMDPAVRAGIPGDGFGFPKNTFGR